jgi:lipopolysaccharide transport system permease protein
MIPEKYRFIYMLNPVTRLTIIYRDIFLYGTMPNITDFAVVFAFGIVLVLLGSLMFKKLSRRFAEEV